MLPQHNGHAIHTVGGVISNGETIMQIVPRADDLVVEAKVSPSDIDQVAVGAETAVRVLAGNQRTTPVITGRLTRVSADITRDQQQNSARPIRLITPSASRCRPKRWPACTTFISFPACRLRASSRPTNAAHCNTCSSRYKSRSRGRFASGENGAEQGVSCSRTACLTCAHRPLVHLDVDAAASKIRGASLRRDAVGDVS